MVLFPDARLPKPMSLPRLPAGAVNQASTLNVEGAAAAVPAVVAVAMPGNFTAGSAGCPASALGWLRTAPVGSVRSRVPRQSRAAPLVSLSGQWSIAPSCATSFW